MYPLSRYWDYILETADRRRRNNRTPRHIEKRYLEVIGAAGELVAHLFLGLPPELHCRFDGGIDFIWAGYKVDVKTTILTPRLHCRYLQWPAYRKLYSEIVFMAAVHPTTKLGQPVGWAFACELLGAPINYGRDTPCHEILSTDLRPPEELFSLQGQSQEERSMLLHYARP